MSKNKLFLCCLVSFLAGIGATVLSSRLLFRYQRATLARSSSKPADEFAWNLETSLFQAVGTNKNIVMLGDSRIGMMDWGELLHRNDVSTRGISSESTRFLLKRLDMSLPRHAKVVFVESGINDLAQGATDADLLQDYSELSNRLKTKADHIVIVSIIQTGHNHEDFHQRLLRLNAELKKLAAQNHASFMDLNAQICPSGYLEKNISPDGIHISFPGYLIWSELIQKKLAELKI